MEKIYMVLYGNDGDCSQLQDILGNGRVKVIHLGIEQKDALEAAMKEDKLTAPHANSTLISFEVDEIGQEDLPELPTEKRLPNNISHHVWNNFFQIHLKQESNVYLAAVGADASLAEWEKRLPVEEFIQIFGADRAQWSCPICDRTEPNTAGSAAVACWGQDGEKHASTLMILTIKEE